MVVELYRCEEQGNLRLQGTQAMMTLGPRVMDELLANEASFADNFFSRFRTLNYAQDNVYCASVIVVGQENTDDVVHLATLIDGVPTLLPTKASFVMLNTLSEDERLTILFDDFVRISGDSLVWLSEDAVLTAGQEGEAWLALIEQARPFHVEELFGRT